MTTDTSEIYHRAMEASAKGVPVEITRSEYATLAANDPGPRFRVFGCEAIVVPDPEWTGDPSLEPNFKSPNHASYCGMIWGLAMKHGIDLTPIVDADNNLTPRFILRMKLNGDSMSAGIAVVVPPPPDGWSPNLWLTNADRT